MDIFEHAMGENYFPPLILSPGPVVQIEFLKYLVQGEDNYFISGFWGIGVTLILEFELWIETGVNLRLNCRNCF